ncbi:MAG: hypothetical protein WCE79_05330 [Xanthobacteraceae bacterium]
MGGVLLGLGADAVRNHARRRSVNSIEVSGATGSYGILQTQAFAKSI